MDKEKENALVSCPRNDNDRAAVRELMTRIGDKWTILLIVSLAKTEKQRARFSEIEKTIPGISQRMLSLTLKNLERDGMVTRHVYPEVPPRVEYELTDLGRCLLAPMKGIIEWVEKHWDDVQKSRDVFDQKSKPAIAATQPLSHAQPKLVHS